MTDNYTVKVIEKNGELTAKDIIKAKDISNTTTLDSFVDTEAKNLGRITGFLKLHIHNPKSKDETDYEKLVLKTADGEFYSTGSESFENSFRSLWDEVTDLDEDWALEVFKKPSKNYSGKGFITCTII